jgi:hypothetical protein
MGASIGQPSRLVEATAKDERSLNVSLTPGSPFVRQITKERRARRQRLPGR